MEEEKTIERDLYGRVVALSPEAARRFFGVRKDADVIDDGPANDPRYLPEARLYRVQVTRT